MACGVALPKSCAMPAADGQVIHTRTEKVKKAREANKGRTAMYTPEEILKEHPFPAGK